MKIQLNKRSIFYILLVILLVLLAVRYVAQIEIPRMLLTLIVIIMALFGDQNEILAISMGCIPMHQAINFYIAIVGCACFLLLKTYKCIRIRVSIILILLMIIWELLHCLTPDLKPVMLLMSLAPFIFMAVSFCSDFQDLDYAFVVRIMVLISVYIGLLQIASYVVYADGDIMYAFITMRRLGTRFGEDPILGGAINPNSLGVINVIGMTALLQIRFNGIKKKIDIVLFFFLLTLGFLTQSKTFFVCLIMMLVMVLFANKTDLATLFRGIIGVAIICSLMIVVVNNVFPGVLTRYMERFQVADITSGREAIMSEYHRYIVEHPNIALSGVGVSDFVDKVTKVYNISPKTPHNSIQEIVVAWGLPGLIMMTLMIIAMIIESAKNNRRKNVLNFIPLVIIIVKSMVGQLLTSNYSLLALVFAYLSLCQDFSPKNRQDKIVYNEVSENTEI